MANAIIAQLSREVGHAYTNGRTSLRAFGKLFKLEKVFGNQWRLTDEAGNDVGLRFNVNDKKLSFFMA